MRSQLHAIRTNVSLHCGIVVSNVGCLALLSKTSVGGFGASATATHGCGKTSGGSADITVLAFHSAGDGDGIHQLPQLLSCERARSLRALP